MPDVKPPKRTYRSPRRTAHAAETREAILAAAHQLFLTGGWTNTTIAAVASAAGVANETVYASLGSKAAILQELVVRAVRADDRHTPLKHQQARRAIMQETDQRRQIALFATDIVAVLDRVAPLMDVVRAASDANDEIAALYAQLHHGRLKNLEWLAGLLLQNGPLRRGLDAKAAGAIIWRLASPELFLLARRIEKASSEAYAHWLANTLGLLFLEDAAAGPAAG